MTHWLGPIVDQACVERGDLVAQLSANALLRWSSVLARHGRSVAARIAEMELSVLERRDAWLARAQVWMATSSPEAPPDTSLAGLARLAAQELTRATGIGHAITDAWTAALTEELRAIARAAPPSMPSVRALLERTPVLLRAVLVRVDRWIETYTLLAQRFAADFGTTSQIAILHPPLGDWHGALGATCALDLADGRRIVYRPKVTSGELAARTAAAWLAERAGEPVVMLPALEANAGYGWRRWVERTEPSDAYDVRFGQLLAFAGVLGCSDLHADNVISHGDWPVPIDIECSLVAELSGEGARSFTDPDLAAGFSSSCARTGLLPSHTIPIGHGTRETCGMGERRCAAEDVRAGYQRIAELLVRYGGELQCLLVEALPNFETRVLVRNTAFYLQLIARSYSRGIADSAGDRLAWLDASLWSRPPVAEAVAHELVSVLDGDVPWISSAELPASSFIATPASALSARLDAFAHPERELATIDAALTWVDHVGDPRRLARACVEWVRCWWSEDLASDGGVEPDGAYAVATMIRASIELADDPATRDLVQRIISHARIAARRGARAALWPLVTSLDDVEVAARIVADDRAPSELLPVCWFGVRITEHLALRDAATRIPIRSARDVVFVSHLRGSSVEQDLEPSWSAARLALACEQVPSWLASWLHAQLDAPLADDDALLDGNVCRALVYDAAGAIEPRFRQHARMLCGAILARGPRTHARAVDLSLARGYPGIILGLAKLWGLTVSVPVW